jgi:hypothetical protein
MIRVCVGPLLGSTDTSAQNTSSPALTNPRNSGYRSLATRSTSRSLSPVRMTTRSAEPSTVVAVPIEVVRFA